MPSVNENNLPLARGRRAAYSVVEVASLCRLSRARFYDLINDGVMPRPVYSTVTRRPLYTAELAAACLAVRETNVGADGRYVLFQERRSNASVMTPVSSAPPPPTRRSVALDPLMLEMVEALRSMGIAAPQDQIAAAIRQRSPTGLTEASFERDLLGLYNDLRRPTGA